MEILSKEEANVCKGGRDYIPTISGYVAGFSNIDGGFSTGIYMPPYYSGSTGLLGGSGTDDDPYLLSEVVVTGNSGGGKSSSNFGGSICYTGGGWSNSYKETGMYGPSFYENPYTGGYDSSVGGGSGVSSSSNTFVQGVGAATFGNTIKTEMLDYLKKTRRIST